MSVGLDYCNSLLYGLPDTLPHKLQSVQSTTARLITGTRRRDHIIIIIIIIVNEFHRDASLTNTSGPVLRRYYANSIGYTSENVSSSKWHVWFVSRCLGRRLSTWQMTAASCPTALGALCGQLTFHLAWCREHSAVTATELLQLLDLACGTLFRSSCAIQTSPTDCSDDI